MMMTLGLFVFSINNIAYQELTRRSDWRHSSNNRIGQRPASQYLGPGDDRLSLSGTLMPELAGNVVSLDLLRLMADQGDAQILVSGRGEILGLWVIEAVSETQTIFYPNGAPRRIEFGIELKRIDDKLIDRIGIISSASKVLNP